MEQKYRTLDVGEKLVEGDEYLAVETNLWKPVRNFYPVDFVGFYRRPVAVEKEYRDLTFDDSIQPGDEVWEFGKGPWEPVSVSEHGQQYRHGYWRMRRPVAAEKPVLNGCGVAAEEDTQPQTVASISTELTEVREAWLKDHMEMKRKLDAAEKSEDRYENLWTEQCDHVRSLKHQLEGITKSWYDQRAELADAKNQITDLQKTTKAAQSCNLSFSQKIDTLNTILSEARSVNADLTRRLEDALSDKVIAEKRLKNLEHHVEVEHVASWTKIQQVLPESREGGSLVDQIIGHMHQLAGERDNWMETAAQHSRNQEFYHGLVTDIGNMFGLRARISDDGTICEGVLALRVPELVAELIVENS